MSRDFEYNLVPRPDSQVRIRLCRQGSADGYYIVQVKGMIRWMTVKTLRWANNYDDTVLSTVATFCTPRQAQMWVDEHRSPDGLSRYDGLKCALACACPIWFAGFLFLVCWLASKGLSWMGY